MTGTTCQLPVDYCSVSPCLNGATCLSGPLGFQCICPDGWTGDRCGQLINLCASSPCGQNGICVVSSPGNYACSCKLGYEGPKCNSLINLCANNPCQNGATCTMLGPNNFVCLCGAMWTGKNDN